MSEEKRAPLFPDEEMLKSMGKTSADSLDAFDHHYRSGFMLARNFYERLITIGRLSVLKTIDGDPIEHVYQCAGVHIVGVATERINHCPGCGAKIIKP